MNAQEIKETSKKYVLQSWSKQAGLNPIVIDHAEGIYMYDAEGNRYTDMSSQLVNLNVGFGNKAIGDAIKAQVDKLFREQSASGQRKKQTTLLLVSAHSSGLHTDFHQLNQIASG